MPRRWTRPENSNQVPDFMGNPELLPESAWILSLGWDLQPATEGGARWGVTGLLERVDDLILGERVLLDGQYVLRRGNFGRAWVGTLQARWQHELQAAWRRCAASRALAPGSRLIEQGSAFGSDLAAAWQQDADTRWRLSASGLDAVDETEALTRSTADGVNRQLSRTQRAPHWRVQWTTRF